jgi:protein-L-isoaspartate(D-aspartate) O-methyltransferase
MERLEAHRLFYANLLTASSGLPVRVGNPITEAFASVPRERFVGPGPWKVFTRVGYITTPSDDPALLYQDIVVALSADRGINNGQPSLHAICLSNLNVNAGETILHIGAGAGYYTALLSHLTGPSGRVLAYELESDLARRATDSLRDYPNVTVYGRSGSEGPLPQCDVIYVNAGATDPLDIWLDALIPDGRLLFPLTPPMNDPTKPSGVFGGMLLVTRSPADQFDARFVCAAMFIACVGARDDATAAKLSQAFPRGDWMKVRSLRRNTAPDSTCWVSGRNWWLSFESHVQSAAH